MQRQRADAENSPIPAEFKAEYRRLQWWEQVRLLLSLTKGKPFRLKGSNLELYDRITGGDR